MIKSGMTCREAREKMMKNIGLRDELVITAPYGIRVPYYTNEEHVGWQINFQIGSVRRDMDGAIVSKTEDIGATLCVLEGGDDELIVSIMCEKGEIEEKYKQIAWGERHRDFYYPGDLDEDGYTYIFDFEDIYRNIEEIGERLANKLADSIEG